MKPIESKYVEVRQSPIHGTGIFAACDIPKGARIIEYVGDKITKSESDSRAIQFLTKHAEDRGDIGAVYIFTLNKRHDIDGSVSWNTARFINHSCNANCESDIIQGKIWIKALCDIKASEELSYDYGYDMTDWGDHPCRCGQPNCIGYIVDKTQRSKLKKKMIDRELEIILEASKEIERIRKL